MSRLTSPTPQKQLKPVVISKDIKEASNEKLVAMLSHKAYDFCVNQDMGSKTLEIATDKLEQLILESLERIFRFNGIENVSQFKIYETIELLFDDDMQYNTIKSLSLLRRAKYWSGIDPDDEKYISWAKTRIKRTSKGLCNKLDFITQQERLETTQRSY